MRKAILVVGKGVHRGAQWCGDSSIRKGVYFALFLTFRKPEKLLITVNEHSNNRCPSVCYFARPYFGI